MKTWSFYDERTGLFLGRRFSGPEGHVKANTRPGSVAIEGHYDRDSQRVDLETGAVIAYERPRAELEAEQRAAQSERARHRIEQLERSQARSVRELVLNGDEQARERLAEIDAEVATLRTSLK